MVCRQMFITLLLRAPPDQEPEPWVRICEGPSPPGAVWQIRNRVRELQEEVAGTHVATPGEPNAENKHAHTHINNGASQRPLPRMCGRERLCNTVRSQGTFIPPSPQR
ncbi:hypothetical protein N9L68_08705 [bacterium]|nr:hypothetical protein [bacterium]